MAASDPTDPTGSPPHGQRPSRLPEMLASSLRARLLLVLLVLAAAAIGTAAVVTYGEQRSFLLARVDGQAAIVEAAVSHKLDVQGSKIPAGLVPPEGSQQSQGTPALADEDAPAEAYGQRRDAAGRVVGAGVVLSLPGQPSLPAPILPAQISVGRAITVASVGNTGLQYRVLAFRTPGERGITVVAVPLTDVSQALHRLLVVEVLVTVAILLALAALAWWLVGLGLRPLARMEMTAAEIAAGDLTRRVSPATTSTEVGRLGLALNAMLAQIEEAFGQRQASEDRLKSFLSDASHELRTPLTSIRGYAELLSSGKVRDPEDAERAATRIVEQAARMGVLIEDLLVLARLDEAPSATLTAAEPVAMGKVAAAAVDTARMAAPERTIELVVEGNLTVLGDHGQLERVLDNLLGNALSHTPEGTRIDVRLTRRGVSVLVEVRDHGLGLPSTDPSAVFARFWRAEGGRTRGPAGAGLGLSIVAAIVKAHDGTVSAANTKDGGASFVVSLPAATLP